MSIPERLCYGARDLRRYYNGHLFAAMIVSVCLHLALIGLYMIGPGSAGADPEPEPPSRIICSFGSYDGSQMDTGRIEFLHSGNPVAVPDSLFEPCYIEYVDGETKYHCPHERFVP